MRVSKVSSSVCYWANVQKLYEICETELYKDCLVADIDTFAQDIGTNPRKVEKMALIKTPEYTTEMVIRSKNRHIDTS